jgi:glycosyltransferase involved in cell wall biosynthesis
MSRINNPLITIGITSYNSEKTIDRALRSALNQSWKNKEIIIIDDYSQDNSIEIINKIIKKYTFVKFIQNKKNLGYPACLNTIIKNSNGKYVCFFDDDDYSSNLRLSKQFKRLENFKTQALCYSHRNVYKDNSNKIDSYVQSIGSKPNEPFGDMVVDYILLGIKKIGYSWGEFGSGTLMASSEILKKYMFDVQFKRNSEWDLAIRFAIDNGYFISVNEPLVSQYKTYTDDKSGTIPLKYSLILRKKHKILLTSSLEYIGSILYAYTRFFYFRKKFILAKITHILSFVILPHKIFLNYLKNKLK